MDGSIGLFTGLDFDFVGNRSRRGNHHMLRREHMTSVSVKETGPLTGAVYRKDRLEYLLVGHGTELVSLMVT